ncbi:MAG TPA: sigma-70 family RNA polymerase sigma factor [Acidimicrobiales bacterium]|nr:sigma-70 family RNA polymerase sigma factor [Acidimicrobiales bacterium]
MQDRGWGDELSDEALLAGVAVGDERAALVFVRRYQRRLFGLAMGILGDPGQAEDVAQEAFIRILRHASVFDARRGAVSTWCLTITRNLAIDTLRLRRAIPTPPDDPVFAELRASRVAPEDAVIAGEGAARALAALADLPDEQRRAVVLSALYGRSAAEVATLESIPLGTAKSRIRLGLSKLRQSVVPFEAT